MQTSHRPTSTAPIPLNACVRVGSRSRSPRRQAPRTAGIRTISEHPSRLAGALVGHCARALRRPVYAPHGTIATSPLRWSAVSVGGRECDRTEGQGRATGSVGKRKPSPLRARLAECLLAGGRSANSDPICRGCLSGKAATRERRVRPLVLSSASANSRSRAGLASTKVFAQGCKHSVLGLATNGVPAPTGTLLAVSGARSAGAESRRCVRIVHRNQVTADRRAPPRSYWGEPERPLARAASLTWTIGLPPKRSGSPGRAQPDRRRLTVQMLSGRRLAQDRRDRLQWPAVGWVGLATDAI